LYVDGPPKIVNLGPAQGASLRVLSDSSIRKSTGKTTVRADNKALNTALLERCRAKRAHLETISKVRGKLY